MGAYRFFVNISIPIKFCLISIDIFLIIKYNKYNILNFGTKGLIFMDCKQFWQHISTKKIAICGIGISNTRLIYDFLEKENVSIDVYKKLICDMIQNINDLRFIRQIYSIVYNEKRRTGI